MRAHSARPRARHTLHSVFRLSARADPAFLAEMLYEAVNWRDDGAEERPPFDEMMARPELRRYIQDWGRVGDAAIVALDRRDEPVGGAWYRLFRADEAGYGFVDDNTPELSIALYPECRRQHIGGLLLGTLLQHARSDGFATMSLSVAKENPARRLYARHGFEVVGESGDSLTMVADLS
jgi:ribosomal protein S18 acetylase RimI-like enzyme